MKKIILIAALFLTACSGTTEINVHKVTEDTSTAYAKIYSEDGRRFDITKGSDRNVTDIYKQYEGKTVCVNYSNSMLTPDPRIDSICEQDVKKGAK